MRKFFLENIGLKIAAVLLSIVLWVFVTSRGQSELSVEVPLELRNIPQGLEVVNHTVKTITLTIRGQERFIKNIRPSDIRVPLDLSKARQGEGVYYIHRDDIIRPHAITIANITPSSVKVTVEETVKKMVKVIPLMVGEPDRGYRVKSVDVTPQTVEIEGIRSEIARVKNIKTEPLDITGLNETFSQELRLELPGRNIRSAIGEVDVRVVMGVRGR